MKIKVGEYVRFEDGKIERVNYQLKEFIDEHISKSENNRVEFLGKIKHSKNIINLVEVGDYVNGKKIEYILEPSIKIEYVAEKILIFETDFPIEKGLRCYHDCDIKSIVTHEQFKSIEYKV